LLLVPMVISHARRAGFAGIYRVFGLLTLLLPILILSNWGRGSYLPWSATAVEFLYQVLGFAVSVAAIWWGVRREHTGVINTGATFFAIFLCPKFYDWWREIMPKFVFFLRIALTSILLIVVMKRLRAGARAVG